MSFAFSAPNWRKPETSERTSEASALPLEPSGRGERNLNLL